MLHTWQGFQIVPFIHVRLIFRLWSRQPILGLWSLRLEPCKYYVLVWNHTSLPTLSLCFCIKLDSWYRVQEGQRGVWREAHEWMDGCIYADISAFISVRVSGFLSHFWSGTFHPGFSWFPFFFAVSTSFTVFGPVKMSVEHFGPFVTQIYVLPGFWAALGLARFGKVQLMRVEQMHTCVMRLHRWIHIVIGPGLYALFCCSFRWQLLRFPMLLLWCMTGRTTHFRSWWGMWRKCWAAVPFSP